MELEPLTALSPVDGRYAAKVDSLRPIFSEMGLIQARLRVEVAWLQALAACPEIPEVAPLSGSARSHLTAIVDRFDADAAREVKALEATTNHDVKAVEYYLKRMMKEHAELAEIAEFVHFACTSEDINNVAYSAMLANARSKVIDGALARLLERLSGMAHELADTAMLSRTHGQSATPTTMGKEVANVVHRLRRARARINDVSLAAKMNGAVGNYNAHFAAYPHVNWPALSRGVVDSLGLEWNPYTIQIEPHDDLAALFDALARTNTICIDWCRDVWSYISLGYFTQRAQAGEVGSSTMPHKVNPIDFENAEGNLGVANALLRHLSEKLPTSRLQRDLTDSTVLRTIGTALGHSLIAYEAMLKGLGKLEVAADTIASDLNDAWEVLAEPVQTVMRRYGLPEPYEQLKALTRGQAIDRDRLHAFIRKLELPVDVRDQLLALTPASYLGNAALMARSV